MDQPGSGLGKRRDGRYRCLPGIERGGCAGLVVVFHEPHQVFLVGQVPGQMAPHRLRRTLPQPVVEPFVVAEVETLLLQRPFQVPVGLGEEHEPGPVGAEPGLTVPGDPGHRLSSIEALNQVI